MIVVEAKGLLDKTPGRDNVEKEKAVKSVAPLVCYISVGSKKWRTHSKANSLDPKWNEFFILEDVPRDQAVTFTIREKVMGKGEKKK